MTLKEMFAYKLEGIRFQLFADYHIVSLVIICLIFVAGILLLKRIKTEQTRRRFRITFAIALFLIENSRILWVAAGNVFSIQKDLPLELSSLLVYATIFLLLTKKQFLYEYLYFVGIAGPSLVLVTPNAIYPPPHFHYFHSMTVHAIIVFTALYFTFVEKYKPRNAFAVLKVFTATNIYLVFVYCMNLLLGSNYMVLMRPIENPTLADVFIRIFGRPPLHIIGFELIAIVLFTLLYIPWRIIRTREKWNNAVVLNEETGG